MDERVKRAMSRWPDVPAAYGWLSLDLRGRWRLDGGVVRNRATRESIDRNYHHDDQGQWYYQNGPQKVFVSLDYTPWIYQLDGSAKLRTHTGLVAYALTGVWLDEELNLLIMTEHGIGVVSDQDCPSLLEGFCDMSAKPLDVDEIEQCLATSTEPNGTTGMCLKWPEIVPIKRIARKDVATRFGFEAEPAPPLVAKSNPQTSAHRQS